MRRIIILMIFMVLAFNSISVKYSSASAFSYNVISKIYYMLYCSSMTNEYSCNVVSNCNWCPSVGCISTSCAQPNIMGSCYKLDDTTTMCETLDGKQYMMTNNGNFDIWFDLSNDCYQLDTGLTMCTSLSGSQYLILYVEDYGVWLAV